ncbi:MAG TPA: thiamine pyrophosphate-binding protein, partial [Candidatus Dormibacteraeota bacterium]|nr:thiamine pyrophosphate-binding protein [Candidatus Dormibacteraeota bacterium]
MPSMSGADIVTRSFEDNHVRCVFSIPGGPILPIYDGLRRSNRVRNILVRHEGAGSFMAEAYAKVSGGTGVCMSTMGPGAENMTVGVGTALSDSTPMVAIAGQLSTDVVGRGYQQETDHVGIFKPITKWSTQVIRAELLPATMKGAFCVAREGRPGPVFVDLPKDIQQAMVEIEGQYTYFEDLASVAPNADSVTKAIQILLESKRPVLLVGGGVITANASAELTKLAQTLRIPVVTSYNGRGAISEDMEESLGRAGEYTTPIPKRVLGEADLVFVLGYRFTDVSIEGWKPSKEAKIVQVDLDPRELGKNYTLDLGIHSDARLMLDALLSEIKNRKLAEKLDRNEWLKRCALSLAEWRKGYQEKMLSNTKPIKPQRVIHEINRRLPSDAIVAGGAGRCKMWAATLIPIRHPRSWVHSGGYAAMGYALCGAIGAKFAEPKRQVFAIDGDGAFQMHCQEIATARENDLSFSMCVLNDMSLGAIRAAQIRS